MIEEIIPAADMAMYQAQKEGGDRVVKAPAMEKIVEMRQKR